MDFIWIDASLDRDRNRSGNGYQWLSVAIPGLAIPRSSTRSRWNIYNPHRPQDSHILQRKVKYVRSRNT